MIRPSRRLLALVCLGSVPAAFAGVSTFAAGLALALDAGLLGLFLLDAWLLGREPRALVQRSLPERIARNRPFALRWQAVAKGPRPRLLRVSGLLPPAFEPRQQELELRVGGAVRENASEHLVVARRRGRHPLLPPAAEQPTPLGLGVARVSAEGQGSIDVLPDTRLLGRFEALRRQSRLHEMGLARARERGEGTEIAGLRPYALGDPFARVDWKATARRGALTTREMQSERRQNVTLLLDCGRRMAGEHDGQSRLDHAVEAALLLSHVALASDDRVALAAFADRLLRVVQPVRGAASAGVVAQALFALTPVLREPPYEAIAAQLGRLFTRRSLFVLFTDAAEPASLAALAKPLAFLSRKHLVLCVVFRDLALDRALAAVPQDVPGLYRTGAAAELAAEREQSVKRLSRAGVLVLEATPGQLSTQVVNRYLEIKARRLL